MRRTDRDQAVLAVGLEKMPSQESALLRFLFNRVSAPEFILALPDIFINCFLSFLVLSSCRL